MAKSKNTPNKKKKASKKQKNNFLKKTPLFYINVIIIILTISIIIFLLNAIIFENKEKENIKKPTIIKHTNKKENVNKILFEEETKELKVHYVEPIQEKKEVLTNPKTQSIFKINKNQEVKKQVIHKQINTKPLQKKEKINKNNKPLLSIIIDDVTTSSQIKKAKNLPFKVTLSFLPPTPTHKNSAKISHNLKVHMIHLPLEAGSRSAEEVNTLHIEDSYNKIENRIKYLKSIYPNVKYINNHTGSKFTSNLSAMDKLAKALKKYNYYFIDSRTTAKTKIKTVAKKYNLKYLSRNVFLDNKKDIKYIQNQLQQAVNIAKKHGSSIAICHPYSITFKSLALSSDILKDVNVVYVNELHIGSNR